MEHFRTNVKFLTETGEPHLFSKRLILTETHLHLGKKIAIPLEDILHVAQMQERVFLLVQEGPDKRVIHRLQVNKFTGARRKAEELKPLLDRLRSACRLKKKLEEMTAAGRADEMKVVRCVYCQSFIDLTGLGECKQVHCEFCPSFFTAGRDEDDDGGRDYYFCEECENFSHRQDYPTITMFFLVAGGIWTSYRNRLCPGCARRAAARRAWFCLFFSTILTPFTVGLNLSSYLKARRAANRPQAPEFAGLDRANTLARKKRFAEALAAYQEVPAAQAGHVGVLTNMAHACLNAQNVDEGILLLEKTIALCPNLWPNYELLADAYDLADRPDDAAAVLARLKELRPEALLEDEDLQLAQIAKEKTESI